MKPSTGRQSDGALIILGGPGKFFENGLKIVHFRAISKHKNLKLLTHTRGSGGVPTRKF